MSGKLSTIIAADMGWWTVPGEQISEHSQHIIAPESPFHMDCQTLPAILVYDGEHPERLAIACYQ